MYPYEGSNFHGFRIYRNARFVDKRISDLTQTEDSALKRQKQKKCEINYSNHWASLREGDANDYAGHEDYDMNALNKENVEVETRNGKELKKQPERSSLYPVEKEHKAKHQCTLGTWIIHGTERERSQLLQREREMKEREEMRAEIESAERTEETENIEVIRCLQSNVWTELSWNERSQRIYFLFASGSRKQKF